MSSNLAISVENLSKCYQIYAKPHDRLKQSILPRLQRIWRKPPKQYYREFWALSDISFDIEKGQTIGIIGRNGSGKSTLLQLLCGTLSPTSGNIQVNGRVAALLELGAGFNPEFTGRENVYLNATILGLSKEDVDSRYERIAAFADIGDFINQPVKTYSSGMYVRLAFAVIAHVDADILVIDEALAVGDAIFTQKCMRFIRSFQAKGTLLFVSHDIGSVLNLCEHAIWLANGAIQKSGPSKAVADAYLQYTFQESYGETALLNAIKDKPNEEDKQKDKLKKGMVDYNSKIEIRDNLDHAAGWATGAASITAVTLENLDAHGPSMLAGGEQVRLTIKAKAFEALDRPILGFLVRDRLGQDLFGENTLPFTAVSPEHINQDTSFLAHFDFVLPMLPNGQYSVMASVANGDLTDNVQHHFLHDALIFNVASSVVRWGLVGIQFDKVVLEKVHS